MIEISGSTKVIPVIGNPTPQVKAPHFFNAYFKRQNIDAVMIAMEMADDAAGKFLDLLRGWTNCPGAIATIPHKQHTAAACDELSRPGICTRRRQLSAAGSRWATDRRYV